MWRLWNKLFGWHYAIVIYGNCESVERVHTDGYVVYMLLQTGDKGRVFYYLLEDLSANNCNGGHVSYIPLTFKPEELIK